MLLTGAKPYTIQSDEICSVWRSRAVLGLNFGFSRMQQTRLMRKRSVSSPCVLRLPDSSLQPGYLSHSLIVHLLYWLLSLSDSRRW